MKKLLLLAFQLGFLLPQLSGQSTASYLKSAEEAFAAKDYATAYIHAKEVLKRDSSANLDLLKIAMMASVEVCEFDQAEQYMRTISSIAPDDNDPILTFYRAKNQHRQGNYEEAIQAYDDFIGSSGSNNPELVALAKQKVSECNQLLGPKMYLVERDSNPSISTPRMLEDLSTPGQSDFAMPIFKDNIIVGKHTPPEQCECEKPCSDKISLLERNTSGAANKLALPKSFKKVGHITYANEGQRVYFTSCKCKDDSYTCEIYYADRDGSSTGWSSPVKLPAHINHGKGYTSTQPFYLEGKDRGKDILFYVSDFHGGQGSGREDLDIYYSIVEGNDHKPSVSLNEINTTGDEVTPYFHNSTRTFFFSSNGYMTLGGFDFDIFKYTPSESDYISQFLRSTSEAENSECSGKSTISGFSREVQNMGSPINTQFDDLFFSQEEGGDKMIFSSNREGHKYAELEHCCPDVFETVYNPKVDIIVSVFCEGEEYCRQDGDNPEPIGKGVADLLQWEGEYKLPTPERPGNNNVFKFRGIPLDMTFKMTATLGPESGYTPASGEIYTGKCDGETIRLNLVLVPDLYYSINFIDQCDESKAVDVSNFVLRDNDTGQAVPPIEQSGTHTFKYQLCPNTTYSYTTDGCSALDANYRFPKSFSKTITTTCAPLDDQETIPLIPPQPLVVNFVEYCDNGIPVPVNNFVLRDQATGAEISPVKTDGGHTYSYEIFAGSKYEFNPDEASPVDEEYVFSDKGELTTVDAACDGRNFIIPLHKQTPIVLDFNLPLYFDHDQPRVENVQQDGQVRDYTSFFESYLTGVDFDQTVRPYRDDSEYQTQRNQLRLADAALVNGINNDSLRIRYQDYLQAVSDGRARGSVAGSSCNGDTTELAVRNFFNELRSNYQQFTSSLTDQVELLYEAGYDIKIIVEGAASGSGGLVHNNSLSGRRIATITEYFRDYIEKQVGEFDATRFSYVERQKGSSEYEGNYPRRGVCRIYDVRAARDRNIRILKVEGLPKDKPLCDPATYGSVIHPNNN
ncbi:MAG: hypothetical protein HRU41_22570 [Saprospiraceae bacterium]|nr:hypothetical protein [Saprospiraceae bacterium]